MKRKQLLALSLATVIGTSVVSGNVATVHASEYDQSIVYSSIEDTFDKNFSMSHVELKGYGLSDSEIKEFNNFLSSGINVINGEVSGNIDIGSLDNEIQTRGKFSSAVKLIRKAYNKLPSKVKKIIAKYTKLNVLLNLIEHYTGTLEDAIYNACRKVGMPKSVTNFVTKTIMLFVF